MCYCIFDNAETPEETFWRKLPEEKIFEYGGELTLHQWHQITVTFSQTEIYEGIAKLYIDGKLIVSEILMDKIDGTTNPLIIGYKNDRGGGYFNGTIDEVRIYDRALSPQEVKQLYDQYVLKPTNPGGNGLGYLWLIIASVIIAVVIVIALIMLGKKGGKSQPQSYYGYPPQYPPQPPKQGQQPPPQPPPYQQTGYPPPPPPSQGGFMNKPQPPPPQSMGMITVTCPYCGFTSQVPENMRGQWVQCPKCGNRFQVQ